MTPVLRAPNSSGNSVTCDAREQARAGGPRAGSYPRSRKPDLGGNGVSSVTRKNEKLDKQKAKNKGWDEMNSVKRKKTISGQRNGSKMANWRRMSGFHQQSCFIQPESWLMFKN